MLLKGPCACTCARLSISRTDAHMRMHAVLRIPCTRTYTYPHKPARTHTHAHTVRHAPSSPRPFPLTLPPGVRGSSLTGLTKQQLEHKPEWKRMFKMTILERSLGASDSGQVVRGVAAGIQVPQNSHQARHASLCAGVLLARPSGRLAYGEGWGAVGSDELLEGGGARGRDCVRGGVGRRGCVQLLCELPGMVNVQLAQAVAWVCGCSDNAQACKTCRHELAVAQSTFPEEQLKHACRGAPRRDAY